MAGDYIRGGIVQYSSGMAENRILVVGGTGKTGRRVVSRLEAQGVPVRVGSRSGTPRFDWLDESTWEAVLDGVTGAYVVPMDGSPAVPALLKRAAASGVRRLVLLSARGIDVPGYYGEGDIEGQLVNERALRDSGAAWTILRPGWFSQNFSEGLFRDPILAGELRLPAGEGAASFVDVDDIAAVAVAALTQDGHAGEIYELSGPRAVTFEQAAELIGAATGRSVRYVAVEPEAYVAELVAGGLSPDEAQGWTAALGPIRRGPEAKISDGVRRALDRDGIDFAEYVYAAAKAGDWRD